MIGTIKCMRCRSGMFPSEDDIFNKDFFVLFFYLAGDVKKIGKSKQRSGNGT